MSWRPADMPELTGRHALVTGSTSGIGYCTALELLRHGAEVIVAARNPEKGERAAAGLATASGRPAPLVIPLDLADLSSIRATAAQLEQSYDRLDLLVNNAGVMATPYRQTVDGFELQMGTNHLGHFALTARLLPLLQEAPAPRVVTVSSFMHKTVRGISPGDFRAAHSYQKWDAYGKSKLANLLFMAELGRRAEAAGRPLVSVGAHPGFASTELQVAGPALDGMNLEARMLDVITKVVAQPAAAGAWPSLYAATQPGLRSGSFAGPRFLRHRGAPTLVQPSRTARDPVLAGQLWSWSVEATGGDCF